MKKSLIFIFLVSLTLLFACQPQAPVKEDFEETVENQEDIQQEIVAETENIQELDNFEELDDFDLSELDELDELDNQLAELENLDI